MGYTFINLLLLVIAPFCAMAQGFINVAEDFNLEYTYTTDDYGGGVSFVDFDQDGLDDLSFATQQGIAPGFFRNTGSGFEAVRDLITDTSGIKQLLWVDYNNDHILDLYISSEGRNALYRNLGNLELEEVTAQVGFDFPQLESYCSTWFDYNNDGKLDLLVAHRTEEKTGWIDLYRNIDDESFEKVTTLSGLSDKGESVLAMTSFDYNNDGWQDLFLGQDWEKGNILLHNNGNGTFRDVSRTSGIDYKMNSMTATVMDINEDGWQDLYVTNTSLGTVLLVNNGQGQFEEKADYYNLNLGSVTFGAVFLDADNDGDNDLHIGGLLANYSFEDINNEEAYKNRNLDWGMRLDDDFNNGVAKGDFNNDGRVDIVKNSVSRTNIYVSKNSLWQNVFEENNYIKVELIGTISNSFGIGSKILVHSRDKVQHQRVGCGESFSSQHSLIQHFGVSDMTMIDSIEVYWPSGNTSVIKEVPTNQTLTITEPLNGCTDISACNYHSMAQEDNGSCRYADIFYDCDGCIQDSDGDGICDELEVAGCTDYMACNFSEIASDSDGSCTYVTTYEIEGPDEYAALEELKYKYPEQIGSQYLWTITNGTIIAGNNTAEVTVLWYENQIGQLSVSEINAEGCLGLKSTKAITILPFIDSASGPLFVSPNPASDLLTIHNLKSLDYAFHVYNAAGQIILRDNITADNNLVDISAIAKGLYFVEITGLGTIYRTKIFKY